MAIKGTLAAAFLVALVALSSATTNTSTVTATSMDSQNWQQCREQVQRRPFRACQHFFQQRSSSPYIDEEEVLAIANPQQEFLQACCRELKQMDRQQCGCEAIRHAVRQAQQGSSCYQTGQSQQMYQRARSLPHRCRLRQQQCHFSVVFV